MSFLKRLLIKILFPKMAKGEKLQPPAGKVQPRTVTPEQEQKWINDTKAGTLYTGEKFYVPDIPNPTLEQLQKIHKEELAKNAKKVYNDANVVLQRDYRY